MITRRGLFSGIGGGVVSGWLAGCSSLFPVSFRYKMIIKVETPQGVRTGSSVREVTIAKELFKLPESQALDVKFTGEATAVNLPGGQVLFALLGKDSLGHEPAGAALRAFDAWKGSPDVMIANVRALRLGRTVVLPLEQYPILVHFRDVRDPKTVERIEPSNLANFFGKGVKLRHIALMVTDEPITESIGSNWHGCLTFISD